MIFPINNHQSNYTHWIFYLWQPNEDGLGYFDCPYTAGWNWVKTKLNANVWEYEGMKLENFVVEKSKTCMIYTSFLQCPKIIWGQLVFTKDSFLTNKNFSSHKKGHTLILEYCFFYTKIISSLFSSYYQEWALIFVWNLIPPSQSHYREVARWEFFMEQELRFGLDLG